jgi:REP element-mobilizing transposase RayT
MNTFMPYYRRRLPHYQDKEKLYFITLCLAGALPDSVAKRLSEERQKSLLLAQFAKGTLNREDLRTAAERNYFASINGLLDSNPSGPSWLSDPRLADLVRDSILYRDRGQFDLYAFCIMSNHVHMVMATRQNLFDVLGSLKKYTARRCNEILGRKGRFWQREYYDRQIRDEEHLRRVIAYVRNNPVKAGLVKDWADWKWTYVKDGW